MATVTGSPSEAGLVCGHWIMPMLWSGGRTDKISNKLAGDVACLGGLMVEHQPRLLGSRVRFPAGAFAIFSVSAKASLPISLSLFPFLFLSHPLPFLSSSSPFDLAFAHLNLTLRIYPFSKFVSFKVAVHRSSKGIAVPPVSIASCVAFIGALEQLRYSSWRIQGQIPEEKSLKKLFFVCDSCCG